MKKFNWTQKNNTEYPSITGVMFPEASSKEQPLLSESTANSTAKRPLNRRQHCFHLAKDNNTTIGDAFSWRITLNCWIAPWIAVEPEAGGFSSLLCLPDRAELNYLFSPFQLSSSKVMIMTGKESKKM